MADETPAAEEAPAQPELTPEEQAAQDAHTATNEAEQTWAGKVEGRLAAIEAKVGLGDEAEGADETADDAAEKEEKK